MQLPKESLKENSGLYGIRTLDLCDIGAVLYQLSQQASWEQVVELVRYKPVRALHQYRRDQGFESCIFFSGFLFATAKVASITAMIYFKSYNSSPRISYK